MNRILSKRNISHNTIRFEISTSIPVKDIKPGHYVVIRTEKNGPGLPLPVVKTNLTQGTITVIVLISNEYTRHIAELNAGSTDLGIEGPYGYPVGIEHFGTVLCIGRGAGIPALLPVLTELRAAGNQVICVLSAPSQAELVLQNEITAASDEVKVLTDEESCPGKANLSRVLGQVLRSNRINQVIVMGNARSIRETFSSTSKYNVPTQAVFYQEGQIRPELHSIYKISICGDSRSVCVDGTNFNAWYPNFEEMLKRFGETEPDQKKIMNQSNVTV